MIWLVLGVALWWGAHLWKRVAPESRAGLGDRGKGIVAGLLALSVILMVVGYRSADGPVWWGPSAALVGINNLLVLVAFYLFAASGAKSRIGVRFRHPQLTGFSLWAVAHLLVNGDLPSLILFGGLLLWAMVEIMMINRAQPHWTPAAGPIPLRKEFTTALAAVVVYGVVAMIHGWIGPNPFTA